MLSLLYLVVFYCLSLVTSMKSNSFAHLFRQSLNLPGLIQSLDVFKNPKLFLPQQTSKSVNDIDITILQNKGIKCVIFDKDNTLSATYGDQIHPSLVSKINEFKQIFPQSVAILSNSVGSSDDIDYEEAIKTEKAFGIPVIRHQFKKPKCYDEVINHFESRLNQSIQPYEICMIGDRLFTDVVFGNKYKMYSILVDPIYFWKDHPIAIILRSFEKFIVLPIIRIVTRTTRSNSR